MTSFSYNVRFVVPLADLREHPPGERLAEALVRALRRRGVAVRDLDNWRDSGWCLACELGAPLEVTLATTSDGWMLQIALSSVPGLLMRLVGRRTLPEHEAASHALARIIQAVLREEGCTDLRWRINGYPEPNDPSDPPAR